MLGVTISHRVYGCQTEDQPPDGCSSPGCCLSGSSLHNASSGLKSAPWTSVQVLGDLTPCLDFFVFPTNSAALIWVPLVWGNSTYSLCRTDPPPMLLGSPWSCISVLSKDRLGPQGHLGLEVLDSGGLLLGFLTLGKLCERKLLLSTGVLMTSITYLSQAHASSLCFPSISPK